jgi:hypothetical protein
MLLRSIIYYTNRLANSAILRFFLIAINVYEIPIKVVINLNYLIAAPDYITAFKGYI